MSSPDEKHMRRCFDLAMRGAGSVEPNPRVGAVVVRGGRVIGEGWHKRFGGPHAEVNALEPLGEKARGSTLYVSLEPCCHFGKTPPCTDAIIRSGIREVVVAVKDPYPVVAGKGLGRLRKAKIKVRVGVLGDEAEALNLGFMKFHRTGLPYVAAKWAMTLDGKIATPTGDSRWISGPKSRRQVHLLRDEFQAILVGANTAVRDDPMLKGFKRDPIRIVLDSTARTPLDAQVVRTARDQRTILAVTPSAPGSKLRALRRAGVEIITVEVLDLRIVFEELGRAGIQSILVEGGGEVHASVFAAKLADEVIVFIGPKVIGGRESKTPVEGEGVRKMAEALVLEHVRTERYGEDVVIRGRVPR